MKTLLYSNESWRTQACSSCPRRLFEVSCCGSVIRSIKTSRPQRLVCAPEHRPLSAALRCQGFGSIGRDKASAAEFKPLSHVRITRLQLHCFPGSSALSLLYSPSSTSMTSAAHPGSPSNSFLFLSRLLL